MRFSYIPFKIAPTTAVTNLVFCKYVKKFSFLIPKIKVYLLGAQKLRDNKVHLLGAQNRVAKNPKLGF